MTKVTTEELNKLKALRQSTNGAAMEIQDLHIQQLLIEREIEEAKAEFFARIDEQESYLVKLYEKYGEGSLDIETGEIIS